MALTDNIVAYYKLESNSNDSVSTNNGTDTSITYNGTAGKINNGANFNNTSSIIALPSGDYSPFSGTGNWTFNGWVQSTATLLGNEHVIFGINNGGNFQHQTVLEIGGTAKLDLTRRYSDATLTEITGGTTLSINTWYMVSATWDGSNIRVYVNGSSDATAVASTGSADTYTQMNIGSGIESNVNVKFWGGYMDEVGIWSRALSAGEITSLYNSGAGLQYPFGVTGISRLGLLFVG